MTTDFDAIIVGAGPAGAAAAIALARRGRGVLLLDAESPARPKIGESLPGAALPLLRDLGVLEQFLADGHRPCYGNVAYWGSSVPTLRDFLFDPHGPGWHLDRALFERMLQAAARDAGVVVRLGAPAIASCVNGSTSSVTFAGDRKTCRWVVDATGRRAQVARGCGAVLERRDRLTAVFARFRVADDRDDRTWIEAVPDGWWYSASVPGGRRIAAYFTDADATDQNRPRTRTAFAEKLRSTRHLGQLFPDVQPDDEPHVTTAAGTELSPPVGEGWCAVGDAALAFDPLSSQGLFHALYTGLRAAQAVDAALAGSPSALVEYAARLQAIAAAYRRNLAYCYSQEMRWPDRPFWLRRHALD